MKKIVILLCFLLLSGNNIFAQVGKELPKAKAQSLKNDELYFDAVKALMLEKDSEAETLLRDLIKADPNEAAAYFNLARVLLKKGKNDEALGFSQKASSLQPGNKWYLELEANIWIYKNKYSEAASIYKQLSNLEPYNEQYYLKNAFLLQKTGNNKEAINTIDKLIEKKGASLEVLEQKQQLLLKANDINGAVKIAEQLADANPGDSKYLIELAEIYYNNNLKEKAAAVYSRIEKRFPQDALAQLALSEYYRKEKNSGKQEEYFKQSILNKELDPETQLALLVPYLQNKGNDSLSDETLLALSDSVAKQHPKNVQVQAFYGDILFFKGLNEQAARQYKYTLDLDKSKFGIWQQLLYIYTDPRHADSLIAYSEKAIRLFPSQAMAHYLNGIGYFNKQNYAKAIAAVQRGIDFQPEENTELLSEMYGTMGDIYHAENNHKLSDESYKKALDFNPNSATVLNNFAYYLSERGERLAEAEKMSKKSLELRPDEATFLDTYAWICYKQKKYAVAREYMQKALTIKGEDNADATLLEHMGDILCKLEGPQAALIYWQKALNKDKTNSAIQKKIADKTCNEK